MRIIDLTLPLRDGMDYYVTGNLPWEVPFKAELTFPKESGLQLGSFTMYCEAGTRFLCVVPKKVGEVFDGELGNLVMRDAVLLRVPKEAQVGGNPITPEEIEAGIRECPAKSGDAILLYTGHGDNQKYLEMGSKWEPWSPCLSPEAVPALSDYLRQMHVTLFGSDTSNISWQDTDLCTLHREWALLSPRPPQGGPEATEATRRYYESGRFRNEYQALMDLLGICDAVGTMVNLGRIGAERFKLIVAPLKVVDWGYVPATAFAIVD